jgi:hypothetical protein
MLTLICWWKTTMTLRSAEVCTAARNGWGASRILSVHGALTNQHWNILASAAGLGLWLSIIPGRLNGNSLSAEEFRDNL